MPYNGKSGSSLDGLLVVVVLALIVVTIWIVLDPSLVYGLFG